jgi:hypothetical protein
MRIQGHLAAGYLASQGLIAVLPVTSEDRLAMLLVGTLAGGLPDADSVYYFIHNKTFSLGDDFTHHTWFTHTFPPYLLLSFFLFIAGRLFQYPPLQQSAFFLAIPTAVHLLLDSVGSGDGIMLLWPFTRRMFGIGLLNAHGKNWQRLYEASPYVWFERVLIAAAILLLCVDLLHTN